MSQRDSESEIRTISPVDGSVYVRRPLADDAEIERVLHAAQNAFAPWRQVSLSERCARLLAFTEALVGEEERLAQELSWQMGRPIRDTPGEIRGFAERARAMIAIAPDALADLKIDNTQGNSAHLQRFIRREPLGVVFVLAPWNFPFLTAVNTIVPALAAGNPVILKHSAQTPLVAERIVEAGKQAGFPEGLLSYLHLSHPDVARVIADERIAHIAFTGSVEGGRSVQEAARKRFIGVGLELGGKDPAYVRHDANLEDAIASLSDGAFFNAGQSCCGIERIYVARSHYPRFVEGMVEAVRRYRLGDPLDPETTLGPLARTVAADAIRTQVDAATAAGARALVDAKHFSRNASGTPYLAPQILVDVNHQMEIMREETFGPVVGIMAVESDDEALSLMNDSRYGLSAAVYTQDVEAARMLGERIESGTVFMNRCDYLDPHLAWVGVKDSGRGCTLSNVGYEHLTRAKSFHLKIIP